MNTLSIFQRPAIICMTNPSSWDQRSQPFCNTTLNKLIPPSSQTSWKLHAQSKGFGDSSSNSLQKKGNAPKNSSNQQVGDGGDDDDDKIPKIVFDRMITRIVASVGLPMALGFAVLQVIGVLKEKQVLEVPLWVTFITTFVLFGSSVLGVAYGSLSTSWDPEKKGSVLGFEEAKLNWDEMWKEEEEGKN